MHDNSCDCCPIGEGESSPTGHRCHTEAAWGGNGGLGTSGTGQVVGIGSCKCHKGVGRSSEKGVERRGAVSRVGVGGEGSDIMLS